MVALTVLPVPAGDLAELLTGAGLGRVVWLWEVLLGMFCAVSPLTSPWRDDHSNVTSSYGTVSHTMDNNILTRVFSRFTL